MTFVIRENGVVINELNYYDYLDDASDVRLLKIYIRDAQNPFEMPTEHFQKRYRFRQESIFYIVSLIKNDLDKINNPGLPISSHMCVLLTLRFYATASFQIVCGDLLHISQSSASNIISKVSLLLAKLHNRFVKFPKERDAGGNRELFKEMGRHGRWPGLPGIDGAIDCTHVRIVSTPGCQHPEVYRNSKSYFSINVQAVVGPKMEFLNVVTRWAGSTHDSRIFQMSAVYMKFAEGRLSGKLVGDSGYPTLAFILTPVRCNPEDQPAQRYNRAHIKTRNVVERTFGILKRRFPCLSKGLGNKLSTVSHIITACAVLHNVSLMLNDIITFENVEDITDEDERP